VGDAMSDTLIVGIMSVIATVVLAPIVVKLLSMVSEKRSQLLVVLTWNEAGKSKNFEDRVTSVIMKGPAFRDAAAADESKWKEIWLLRSYFSSQSYMRFRILNNSRKKLAHLTLFDNEYSDLCQIDEGGLESVVRGQPIVLGDLQPGRETVLHLWSSSNVPAWNPDTKSRFKFSADELDRVKIKEPMQEFLKRRYIQWLVKYLTICMFASWIGLAVFAYLNK
jgi:hypothetical protein